MSTMSTLKSSRFAEDQMRAAGCSHEPAEHRPSPDAGLHGVGAGRSSVRRRAAALRRRLAELPGCPGYELCPSHKPEFPANVPGVSLDRALTQAQHASKL